MKPDALWRLKFRDTAIGLPMEPSCVKKDQAVWVTQEIYEMLKEMRSRRRDKQRIGPRYEVVSIKCLECGRLMEGASGWGVHCRAHHALARRSYEGRQ